jgi:multidrug resistance efflux pump
MNNSTPFTAPVEAIARLEECRLFEGPAREFWPRFAQTCAELLQAPGAVVLVQMEGSWRVVAGWPSVREFPLPVSGPQFTGLAERAIAEGLVTATTGPASPALVLVSLALGQGAQTALLAVAVTRNSREDLVAAGSILRLAADTPLLYQRQQLLEKTKRDVQHFAQALEILAATNAHTRFLSVSMALVNELASRFKSSRVSLGWGDGAYVRVKAISGTDRFEKKMAVVQKLEAAMEEARDQDEEVLWPAPPDATAIARDHAGYSELEKVPFLLSVPVRIDGEARAVITLERTTTAFTEFDALAVRVVADQVARRLDDLRRGDRWFGARWAHRSREWFSKFLGPRQTWLKVAAVAGAVLLAVATFVPFSYRVDASFIVRADALQHLPAPFDGYIAQAPVRPGDLVREGDVVLKLDTSDLLIEQASSVADVQRHASEAEKAEADRQLSELRVARAMQAQSQAQLDLVRYRLQRAELRAPFDGVVIEGDLRERIGAPVKAGDILLKVSQLKKLYVEMHVPERDIDQIARSRRAEVAFTSRPEDTFGIQIERIEPQATVDRDGNLFIVRGNFDQASPWFRPGMSGIAKIDAGHRSLLWLATHRLIDFLRFKLWW